MNGVVFRSEQPGEEQRVREVQHRAFGDDVIPVLIDTLRGSPDWRGLSYVAERDGEVIASVMFTRSLLDAPRRLVEVLVLSPVGVLPEYQRSGVGSALIRYALDEVAREPEPLVFLEGDPAYYRRFGFTAGGDEGFRKPSLRIPDAAFQVRRQPTYQPWMTGTLVYSRVFWDLDAVGLRDPDAVGLRDQDA